MDIADKIICIPVQSVIIVIPALIRTEFLIGAATNDRAAIETFLFHSTKVSIKLHKNRLQTITNGLLFVQFRLSA
mgnify:CR=1 FL=1